MVVKIDLSKQPKFERLEKTKHIRLEDCKHSYLYRIYSRNLSFGVFHKKSSGFIGIREKFGYEYLFTEYHFDTGAPYGTVHPLEELEKYFLEVYEGKFEDYGVDNKYIYNKELFNWLKEKEKQYYDRIQ